MDWPWIYATLIRNAGWTFAQCWEQPAKEVFEFLEHLSEYPSADVVLRAVHMKPREPKRTAAEVVQDLTPFLGAKQPMPSKLRAMYDAAMAKFDRPARG